MNDKTRELIKENIDKYCDELGVIVSIRNKKDEPIRQNIADYFWLALLQGFLINSLDKVEILSTNKKIC